MKRTILALLLLSLFLVTRPAAAKSASFVGCTKDYQETVLTIDVEDTASDAAIADIRDTFTAVARSLSFAELLSEVGFKTFVQGLTEKAYAAIKGISAPPAHVGSCGKA